MVTINANGKTVHFKKHPQYTFEEMESQNFSYKIQLFPNMTTTVTSESRAYVLYLNDMETEGKCRDGKPTAYQNITSTDERYRKTYIVTCKCQYMRKAWFTLAT